MLSDPHHCYVWVSIGVITTASMIELFVSVEREWSLRLKIMGRREAGRHLFVSPAALTSGSSLFSPAAFAMECGLSCVLFAFRSGILSAATFRNSDTRGINYKRMKSERSIGLYLLAFQVILIFFDDRFACERVSNVGTPAEI